MNSILIEDELFYFGAENYKDCNWELLTNIHRCRTKHSDVCIEHSGLVCKLSSKAYDRFGNELCDSIAIWVPAGINSSSIIDKYFSLSIELGRLYEEKLIQEGKVEEGFFQSGRLPYIGCEKEASFLEKTQLPTR